MESTSIVAILLLILPGILAEKISYRMDYPTAEGHSDFHEIINGILLSLPIVLVSGILSALCNGFTTLSEFISAFDNLLFMLSFAGFAFGIATFLGVAKGLTKGFWVNIVNKIRNKFKKMNIDNKSCWRKVFLEENISRYIKIIKDGQILSEGFALHYSLPNEEKEIALDNPENIEDFPEFKDYLRLCKTYMNIESGVIIEVYDTKKLNEYLEQFKN